MQNWIFSGQHYARSRRSFAWNGRRIQDMSRWKDNLIRFRTLLASSCPCFCWYKAKSSLPQMLILQKQALPFSQWIKLDVLDFLHRLSKFRMFYQKCLKLVSQQNCNVWFKNSNIFQTSNIRYQSVLKITIQKSQSSVSSNLRHYCGIEVFLLWIQNRSVNGFLPAVPFGPFLKIWIYFLDWKDRTWT